MTWTCAVYAQQCSFFAAHGELVTRLSADKCGGKHSQVNIRCFSCQPRTNYLENELLSKVQIVYQNFDVFSTRCSVFFSTDTPVSRRKIRFFPLVFRFSRGYSGFPVSPTNIWFDLTRLKQPLNLSCYLNNPSIVSGSTNLKQACLRWIRLIFDILEAAGMTSLEPNQIHGTDMFTRQMRKPLCITGNTTTANRQKPLWITGKRTTAEEEGFGSGNEASTSFPEPKERSRERGCSSLFHQIGAVEAFIATCIVFDDDTTSNEYVTLSDSTLLESEYNLTNYD